MTTLPEARRKSKAIQQKKLEEVRKKYAIDFADICAKAEGRNVLRYIMNQCGYQKPSVVVDPTTGEINDRSTLYNEARRNLYLDLRKFIPTRLLKKIEFELNRE